MFLLINLLVVHRKLHSAVVGRRFNSWKYTSSIGPTAISMDGFKWYDRVKSFGFAFTAFLLFVNDFFFYLWDAKESLFFWCDFRMRSVRNFPASPSAEWIRKPLVHLRLNDRHFSLFISLSSFTKSVVFISLKSVIFVSNSIHSFCNYQHFITFSAKQCCVSVVFLLLFFFSLPQWSNRLNVIM